MARFRIRRNQGTEDVAQGKALLAAIDAADIEFDVMLADGDHRIGRI